MEKLEEAKGIEDGMSYMEPPRLYQPIRHCLGYVHLNATGDYAAAEQVRWLTVAPTPGMAFPSQEGQCRWLPAISIDADFQCAGQDWQGMKSRCVGGV